MTVAESPRVILASASPRRRALLSLVGIAHETIPADIDESVLSGETPVGYTERLARSKALLIAGRHPDALVIGADTIVVISGDILGKPQTDAEAALMLRRLSGRVHRVYTAVALAAGETVMSAVEHVDVTVRDLTDDDISCYIATGEPMDKAGGYGIQGYGATIVERVDGDYFSVMGLGLRRVIALLQRAGFTYRFAAGIQRSSL